MIGVHYWIYIYVLQIIEVGRTGWLLNCAFDCTARRAGCGRQFCGLLHAHIYKINYVLPSCKYLNLINWIQLSFGYSGLINPWFGQLHDFSIYLFQHTFHSPIRFCTWVVSIQTILYVINKLTFGDYPRTNHSDSTLDLTRLNLYNEITRVKI
jgi:hypothetical protein